MRNALFWAVTHRAVLISCRSYGTAYRSHRQYSWPRTMCISHPFHGGSLKSQKVSIFCVTFSNNDVFLTTSTNSYLSLTFLLYNPFPPSLPGMCCTDGALTKWRWRHQGCIHYTPHYWDFLVATTVRDPALRLYVTPHTSCTLPRICRSCSWRRDNSRSLVTRVTSCH
jgi:hypothetical protein